VEYFKIISAQKRINCNLFVKDDIYLMIDKTKITRVIDNLISNAIKYNKRGGSIYLNIDKKGLHVKDTGIGIDKQKLKLIFNRYIRASENEGGFGIGLHIVAKIAKYYGFKIEVDSSPDKGTTISILFGS
jgi:two-component system OmpR family sensor kinase